MKEDIEESREEVEVIEVVEGEEGVAEVIITKSDLMMIGNGVINIGKEIIEKIVNFIKAAKNMVMKMSTRLRSIEKMIGNIRILN